MFLNASGRSLCMIEDGTRLGRAGLVGSTSFAVIALGHSTDFCRYPFMQEVP